MKAHLFGPCNRSVPAPGTRRVPDRRPLLRSWQPCPAPAPQQTHMTACRP